MYKKQCRLSPNFYGIINSLFMNTIVLVTVFLMGFLFSHLFFTFRQELDLVFLRMRISRCWSLSLWKEFI